MLIIIDFVCADNLDYTNMQVSEDDTVDAIADRLDVLLDLLTGADQFGTPALTAQVEDSLGPTTYRTSTIELFRWLSSSFVSLIRTKEKWIWYTRRKRNAKQLRL